MLQRDLVFKRKKKEEEEVVVDEVSFFSAFVSSTNERNSKTSMRLFIGQSSHYRKKGSSHSVVNQKGHEPGKPPSNR